jgi:metal-responsive CopG/Arc/MetJ family transcriptional regulator
VLARASMSKIISFSVDQQFASGLEQLMEDAGYNNRSRFLRDAAVAFADMKRRGDLAQMPDEEMVEGHLVVYYQHDAEGKLLEVRHSNALNITSYNHSCLAHSHTCVDVLHAIGQAKAFREAIETFNNTPNIDKVTFIAAPMRDEGCC